MDTNDQKNDFPQNRHTGRILAGFFLLLVGAVFLMKESAFFFFPDWLFTWPMILIAVGVYTGIRHQFRNPAWIIMVIVGGVFLADQANLGFDFHRYIAPIIIIAVGLMMIFRPRNNWRDRGWDRWDRHDWKNRGWDRWNRHNPGNPDDPQKTTTGSNPQQPVSGTDPQDYSSQDFFDSTSVFGGVKKIIVSKSFRGGDVTCFMGGCEVDLTQADMQVPAVIDVTQIFGGTKLIVPSHWQVRTDMTAIFGSVEDKRQQPITSGSGKLLILKGTSIFGGIEIKNY